MRASADGSSPSGLDGLTAENLALLREVFWDMNQISSFTETVPKGEEDTETILHITAIVKTSQDLTLSVEQVQEILDSLPDDLSEERRQVILTAYQLLGKVNYFWGGKSLVLGQRRSGPQEAPAPEPCGLAG